MKTPEELFKEVYGISVEHSWTAYNGHDMVKFAGIVASNNKSTLEKIQEIAEDEPSPWLKEARERQNKVKPLTEGKTKSNIKQYPNGVPTKTGPPPSPQGMEPNGWINLAEKKPDDLQDIWRWKEIFHEPKLDVYQTGRWNIGQYGDGTDSWWKPAYIPKPPTLFFMPKL